MRALFVSGVLASMLAAPAAAADKPVVVVFDFDAKDAKLGASTVEGLSEYLRALVAQSGAYQVVPRDDMKQRLTEKKADSYKACFDQSCQIEIGRELAAEKTIATRILRIGSKCITTATMFDLRRAASEHAATHEGPCTEDGAMEATKAVARELTTKRTTPEPARAAEPTPAAPKEKLRAVYDSTWKKGTNGFTAWKNDGSALSWNAEGKAVFESFSDEWTWVFLADTGGRTLTDDDFIVELEVRQLHTGGKYEFFGVMWGVNDRSFDDFDSLWVDTTGRYSYGRFTGGKWVGTGWNASPAVPKGAATYKLTATKRGDRYSFSVNGQEVDAFKYAPLLGTRLGVTCGGRASLEVQSLKVWLIEPAR
ncbi:hypothetical protein L6R52_28615 [Myxococcota bacterium]|nr:hypothetical protein [Myxococcota bacterium]